MRTVFFDVDTQLDFLCPAGALYVLKGEWLIPRIAELNRWAAAHGHTVVSTMDAHAEDDGEFRQWPPHCVVHTTGQLKPAVTLLDKRVVIPSAHGQVALDGAQQVLLEKQTTNCFTNSNIGVVLGSLRGERYVVYGVVTEICVRNAALGLLRTGRPVEIITDAVECLSTEAAAKFFEEFQGKGGRLTAAAEVMAG